MSDFSQGDGWWQASDGRWYPPHQHPAAAQAAPTSWQPPTASSLPPESTSIEPARNGCAIAGIIAAGLLFVIVIALIVIGLFAAGGSSPERATSTLAPTTTVGRDEASSSTVAPTEVDEADDAPLFEIGDLTGAAGTRADPVPVGEMALLDGGWLVRVNGVDRDAWSEIEAYNEFNEPPNDGERFVMADVSATYIGTDEPQFAWAALRLSMVGASAIERVGSCGVVPDELGGFAEVFTGGSISGNTCIVIDEADADSVVLGIAAEFFSDPLLFELGDADQESSPMPAQRGPVAGAARTGERLDPVPVGTEVALDANWTLEIVSSGDRTDDVLAENEFNDAPPPGFRYVVVEYIARYDGEDEPAALLELLLNAVGDSNVSFDGFCGVIPGQPDGLADLYAGATVAGATCFVVPERDLGSEVVYASVGFEDAIVFAIR